MVDDEQSSGIFRKSAKDSISSPEQLDTYIKVANPSVWVTLAAVVVFIIGVTVWAFMGKIPTTYSVNGVVRDGAVCCYVSPDKVTDLEVGYDATVLGLSGAKIASISATPVSAQEAAQGIESDYTVSELALSDWNYVVTISCDGLPAEGTLVPVTITEKEVVPITALLN